jgi:hypothetical protein
VCAHAAQLDVLPRLTSRASTWPGSWAGAPGSDGQGIVHARGLKYVTIRTQARYLSRSPSPGWNKSSATN